MPAPAQVAGIELSDGARIWLRRYGDPRRPRVAFSHGNGLAIDAYAQFWQLFCERFDVVVFDMRNHGRNPFHGVQGHSWERMTLDMHEIHARLGELFGAEPVTGIFHSLSSIAAMQAASRFGPSWQRLVLFDPPIYPRPGHRLEESARAELVRLASRARRRPGSYGHWRDLAEQLRSRPQFSRLATGAHELFARATLREDPETGRWRLACPRELEAHIFETNVDATLWGRIAAGLGVRASFIGADPELENQDAPGRVCHALAMEAGLDYQSIPGSSHMLQMEEPEACWRAVLRCLERA